MIRIALLCALLSAGPGAAQLASKIAFYSHRDGDAEIYAINPDGSGRQNLTNHPGYDVDPAWSPDGTRIAFISNRDNAPDTNGNSAPGTRGNHIFVMNSDGTNPVRVTGEQKTYSKPAWSPDGTRITFQIRAQVSDERTSPFSSTLYTIDAGGGPIRQLIDHRDPDAADPAIDAHAAWSPAGNRIVFASAPFSNYIGRQRVVDLLSFDPADGSLTNLTNSAAGETNGQPVFSPDGARIAFYSRRPDNEGIYVMDADGSNPTPITPVWTVDWAPTWSPAGERIAFVSTRDQTNDIFVMGADGADPVNITNDDGGYEGLAWSPLAEFPTAVSESSWGQLKKAYQP